jgi:hypothetical protein
VKVRNSLFQLFTEIPCTKQGMLYYLGRKIAGFNAKDLVAIMQVYIPFLHAFDIIKA